MSGMKKSRQILFYLAGILLLLVVDFQALNCGFIYDDYVILIYNQSLHQSVWDAIAFNPFRGAVYFTYWLQWKVSSSAFSFRSFNLIVHWLCGLVLILLFNRLFPERKRFSYLCALFFWLNPIFMEAVNFISGRFDLLCALFYLLAVFFWLEGEKRGIYQAIWLLFFTLALFCKEPAVSLPVLIFVLSRFKRRRFFSWWMGVAIIFVLAYIFLRLHWTIILSKPTQRVWSPSEYFLNQNWIVWFGFFKVIFPFHLNFDYQLSSLVMLGAFALVINLLLFSLIVYFGKIRRWLWLVLGYPLIYSPLAFVPLADAFREARIYLAGAWLVILISGCFSWLLESKPRAKPIISLVLIMLFLMSLNRAGAWRSDVSLWRDAVKKSPTKFRAVYNYASALRRGFQLRRAERVYRWAEKLNPESIKVKTYLELLKKLREHPELKDQMWDKLKEMR